MKRRNIHRAGYSFPPSCDEPLTQVNVLRTVVHADVPQVKVLAHKSVLVPLQPFIYCSGLPASTSLLWQTHGNPPGCSSSCFSRQLSSVASREVRPHQAGAGASAASSKLAFKSQRCRGDENNTRRGLGGRISWNVYFMLWEIMENVDFMLML